MRSLRLGKSISKPEVSNISKHGFWLYVHPKEYFLSFEKYPWFKNAVVADILKVRLLHKIHLHWPALDVDLELESLQNPEEYPLAYR